MALIVHLIRQLLSSLVFRQDLWKRFYLRKSSMTRVEQLKLILGVYQRTFLSNANVPNRPSCKGLPFFSVYIWVIVVRSLFHIKLVGLGLLEKNWLKYRMMKIVSSLFCFLHCWIFFFLLMAAPGRLLHLDITRNFAKPSA